MQTLMDSGQHIVVPASEETPGMELTCTHVDQRNWSRVGVGQVSDTGSRVFLKQYVDRTGARQERTWSYEHEGIVLARELLDGVLVVPAVLATDREQLLTVFAYHEVLTTDEIVRRDQAAFRQALPLALKRMAQTLSAFRHPPPGVLDGLPTKERDYGGPADAVNFKGFDFRNVGFRTDPQGGILVEDPIVMFDFGRAYRGPVEEGAARLFVSVGMLNWGKPLGRFIRGPEPDVLAIAADVLHEFMDIEAIRAELAIQRAFRIRHVFGEGFLERQLKYWGIATVGRRYLRTLESWCNRRWR